MRPTPKTSEMGCEHPHGLKTGWYPRFGFWGSADILCFIVGHEEDYSL